MAGNTHEEVEELRALVHELQAETKRLAMLVDEAPVKEEVLTPPDGQLLAGIAEQPTSRRRMFKAGAAVAAVAASTPLLAKEAAAADGGNFVIGSDNTSGGAHTRLRMTGTGLLVNQNVLTVTDDSTTSGFPSAVGAYAQGDRVTNGLYAFADSRDNSDANTGHAIVIAARSGARSHIRLVASGAQPQLDNYSHSQGEIRQQSGNLWFCTSSGTPGTWRKLAGPASSGAIHAISPRRAYDSRFGDGPLSGGENRVISVANAIDVASGASTGTLVPADATAVMFNLTIVGTSQNGFLAVAPGDAATFEASTINWRGSGQVFANGSMSTVDSSRQLRVFAGGGSTGFIIDITGYML